MQEDELLKRAKAGDREAVAGLVEAHQRAVRAYLGRVAPDPASADDLAQDVFLEFFQAIERADGTRAIRPYLLGIARNLARMAWRKQIVRREVSGEVLFDILETYSQRLLHSDEQDDRREKLKKCLQELSPKAREVVLYFYRDELPCDEVAARMKMPSGSIRSILTRGREALRVCIERGGSAEGSPA